MDRYGMVAISPQGVVTTAALTSAQEDDGPFNHYGQCRRDGKCQEAWLPTRASADEDFVWPQLAVTSTTDGGLWFALASPPPISKSAPVTWSIMLIRCDNFTCVEPHRFPLGTIDAQPRNGDGPMRYGQLTVDPDGRPHATFEIEGVLRTATCAPVTCAEPVIGIADPPGSPVPSTVSAEPAAEPIGLHLYIGPRPKYWRYVLGHDGRRVPLDVVKGVPATALVAISSDGRVLVVRQDRIILLPPAS
jgi:hypothetical protein